MSTDSNITTSARSKLKRSLVRLSERIAGETSLEEIVREIAEVNERAKHYLAQRQGGVPQVVHSLEPGGATINIQRMWRHNDSGRVVRITNIQMGPLYRPGDSVTPWVPEKIFWEDAEDPGRQGSISVYRWRRFMTEVNDHPDGVPEVETAVVNAAANNDALRQEIQV